MIGNTGGLTNKAYLSKSYCFFETVASWLKNYNFGLLSCLVKLRRHALLSFVMYKIFLKKCFHVSWKNHGSQQVF